MFNSMGKLSWYNLASEKTRTLSMTGGIKGNILLLYFSEFATFSKMNVHYFNNGNKVAAHAGLYLNVEKWKDDRVRI